MVSNKKNSSVSTTSSKEGFLQQIWNVGKRILSIVNCILETYTSLYQIAIVVAVTLIFWYYRNLAIVSLAFWITVRENLGQCGISDYKKYIDDYGKNQPSFNQDFMLPMMFASVGCAGILGLILGSVLPLSNRAVEKKDNETVMTSTCGRLMESVHLYVTIVCGILFNIVCLASFVNPNALDIFSSGMPQYTDSHFRLYSRSDWLFGWDFYAYRLFEWRTSGKETFCESKMSEKAIINVCTFLGIFWILFLFVYFFRVNHPSNSSASSTTIKVQLASSKPRVTYAPPFRQKSPSNRKRSGSRKGDH